MLKKITVLAMAVGMLAALALPASVSASWKHHSTAIQNDVSLGLTGNVRFQAGLGGVECQITSLATFKAGQTTGTADTFKPHPGTETENCKGLSGLSQCQIHNLTPQAPQWVFHTAPFQTVTAVHQKPGQNPPFEVTKGAQVTNAVVVTTTEIKSQTTGNVFCLFKNLALHNITVGLIEEDAGNTHGDGNTVTNLDVNGSATVTAQTNGGATHTEGAFIQGTLQVESPNQSTYSL